MFPGQTSGSGRKTAAQRSRDLFSSLVATTERPVETRATTPRFGARRPAADPAPEPRPAAAAAAPAREPAPVARLTIVSATGESEPETPAVRIRRLQAEAHALAREEVAALERRIAELAQVAKQLAEGGDAYPVGAREVARRLAEDLPRQAGVLEALLRRA
jgi:hypothetical protein